MTIQIHKPELEALIQERLSTGNFQDVEDLLLQALGGDKPKESLGAAGAANRRLEKELDVWVLHGGQPLSSAVVDDTLNKIREERDFGNLGTLG